MPITDHPASRTVFFAAQAAQRPAWLSVGYGALLVLFFLAPFSVSAFFQYVVPGLPSSILVVAAAAFLLLLHLVRIRRLRFDGSVALVIGLLFVPMLVSFFLIPFNALGTGIDYSEYILGDLWSRMINILMYGVIFLGGWTVILELPEEQRMRVLRAYLAGLCVFIVVGLWQWGSFYLGLPFPDLGSRTYLHSVSAEISQYFPGRLTSLATEPSFLAPLMVDAAIVGAAVMGLTYRYVAFVLLPSAWVLVFSFSGGGFLNLLVLLGFGLLLTIVDMFVRGRIHRWTIAAGALGVCSIVVLHEPIGQVLVPILGRMDMFVDLQAHDRLYMVVMPFVWFADDGLVSALFGHGPGSFALLGQLHTLPDGGPVHVTSNNLFSDVLYEQGAIGLLLVIALFVVLLVTGLRARSRSRECLLGAILTVHLATSSVYRADFMAPRFWVLLLSILTLYQIARYDGTQRDRSRPLHEATNSPFRNNVSS